MAQFATPSPSQMQTQVRQLYKTVHADASMHSLVLLFAFAV